MRGLRFSNIDASFARMTRCCLVGQQRPAAKREPPPIGHGRPAPRWRRLQAGGGNIPRQPCHGSWLNLLLQAVSLPNSQRPREAARRALGSFSAPHLGNRVHEVTTTHC